MTDPINPITPQQADREAADQFWRDQGLPEMKGDARTYRAFAHHAKQARLEERERAAMVAEAMADRWAEEWRAGLKADPHIEGKSDGGDEIADAIRKGEAA